MIVDTDSVLSTKVDNWLLAIEASPFTRRNYVHDLNAYCKFLSKDPDQLLAEAKTEIKQGLLLWPSWGSYTRGFLFASKGFQVSIH